MKFPLRISEYNGIASVYDADDVDIMDSWTVAKEDIVELVRRANAFTEPSPSASAGKEAESNQRREWYIDEYTNDVVFLED